MWWIDFSRTPVVTFRVARLRLRFYFHGVVWDVPLSAILTSNKVFLGKIFSFLLKIKNDYFTKVCGVLFL